jgi:competence protein ComEC
MSVVLEKPHLKQLKILSPFRGNLFYGVILTVLTIYATQYHWLLILILLCLFFLFRVHKHLFLSGLFLIFIVLFSMHFRTTVFNEYEINDGVVLETLSENDHYFSYIVRSGITKVRVSTEEELDVGMKVFLDCKPKEISLASIPGGFDYQQYLYSLGLLGNVQCVLVEIDESFSLPKIRAITQDYIESTFQESMPYINAFIMANTTYMDSQLKEDINTLGIAHLFAVSGLHVMLLVLIIERLLDKTKLTVYMKKAILILILSVYLITTGFSDSILRATLFYGFIKVKKHLDLEWTTIDLLSVIALIFLVINPFRLFNISFLLSYLVTFGLLLYIPLIDHRAPYFKQLFVVQVVAFLISLPVVVSLNPSVNLLSLLVNLFFIVFVSYLILPLTYLTFLCPCIEPLLNAFVVPLEFLIDSFSKIHIFELSVSTYTSFWVLVYYASLLYFFKVKTSIIPVLSLMIMMVFIINMIRPYNLSASVTMLDAQGDAIFIQDAFNQCNILIDTGPVDSYDSVINYMKQKSVNTIDLLIITHEHDDHDGELEDIMTSFKIDTVITKASEQVRMNCGHVELTLYPAIESYSLENNQSMVVYMSLYGEHYLMTGDIESVRENNFIHQFNEPVDILKSPHHGSITSSSEAFLDHIDAEVVWISSFINNLYDHPSEIVIKRYQARNMDIYRIDLDGTITRRYIPFFNIKWTETSK